MCLWVCVYKRLTWWSCPALGFSFCKTVCFLASAQRCSENWRIWWATALTVHFHYHLYLGVFRDSATWTELKEASGSNLLLSHGRQVWAVLSLITLQGWGAAAKASAHWTPLDNRYSSFYWASLSWASLTLPFLFVFYKLKACGSATSTKYKYIQVYPHHLPAAGAHFISLYHILVIIIILQTFSSFLYLLL